MLLRQTLIYLPAQLIGPLAQFASILIWTHYLAPAEMGLFALIIAGQELVYTTVLFWFSIYTIRYFDHAATKEANDRFLATEATAMLAASVATVVAVVVFSLGLGGEWDGVLFAASVAFLVGRTIATQLAERARTTADMMSYSILQITWPIAGLLLAWICVELFGPRTSNVLIGYALGQVIALVVVVPRMAWPDRLSWPRDIVSQALKYSIPLVIGSQLVWLANNGIRFVVEYTEGTEAVGLLTTGWAMGLRVAAFVALLVTAAAFPLAIRKMRQDGLVAGQDQLVRNGLLLLFVMAPAMTGFCLVAPAMVELLVAEEYKAITIEILPWAILGGAARNMRIHFGEQVFLLREQPKIPLINDAVDGLIVLIGAAIGLWWGGIVPGVIGAAIGSVIALLVTAGFGFIMYRYTLPFAEVMRIAVATLIMAAAVVLIGVEPGILSISIAIAVGAVVYASVISLLYPAISLRMVDRVRTLWVGLR